MRGHNNGFTLVEVAIVLLIAGLLLGGVLKAGELIQSARVRNLIAEIEGVQTAYFAFQDRYRGRPGDYNRANISIRCGSVACPFGNGDGLIQENAPSVGGSEVHEDLLVWTHLAASGFMQAAFGMTAGESVPTAQNSPRNPWGPFLNLTNDQRFGDGLVIRHNVKTGDFIPVEVLAETDRKIDDGRANAGRFQFAWMPVPTDPANPTLTGCTITAGGVMSWNLQNPVSNCAGAILLD